MRPAPHSALSDDQPAAAYLDTRPLSLRTRRARVRLARALPPLLVALLVVARALP
jgi:hypothetical protein